MMGRRGQIVLVLGLGALFGLTYALSPGFRDGIGEAAGLLARGDVLRFKEYLLAFGLWAPLISAALMVFQSVVAPLPSFVITVTNGLLFGAFWGTILSWSSSMVGAALTFYIGRALGRPVLERALGARALGLVDRFFRRYGRFAVLLARLIPIMSFDLVSYAAGPTAIGSWEFFIATGLGQLPATVIYSILGERLSDTANLWLWVVGALALLLALAWGAKVIFERRLLGEADQPQEGK
ncbi:MAG: TVP38/TMEM64 family protein [Chloroflexi bacterium]|nr:TVP38/TMEM64 family protein [Chloroflexota bacterium]